MQGRRVLILDVFGVLLDNSARGTLAWPGKSQYLLTPFNDGIIKATRQLVKAFGPSNVHVLSECNAREEEHVRDIFRQNRFHEQTGVRRTQIHSCQARCDKLTWADTLGATHMVDGRLETLSYVGSTVPNRVLYRPDPEEVAEYQRHLSGVVIAENTPALIAAILG